MLIRLDSRLKTIEQMKRDNVPDEELPTHGVLAIIDGQMDFKKTDGYIQFMKLALERLEYTYGKQAKAWKWQIDHICGIADKLCDANVRFEGGPKTKYKQYCKTTAHILASDSEAHPPLLGLITQQGYLVQFMEQHVTKGNRLGFYYEGDEDFRQVLMNDLMEQLSRLKFEKTARVYDTSTYLCDTMYHEHIHDAINLLIQAVVYMINCSSTKKCEAFDFDIMEMDRRLNYIETVIKRMEVVI